MSTSHKMNLQKFGQTLNQQKGFTLIEVILFIIVTSLLVSGILLAYVGSMQNYPIIFQNTIASQTVKACAEWYLGQRRLNGYSVVSGANCTNPLTIPSICSVPSGFSLTGSCTQTTIGGDTNYETITLTASGNGSASTSLLLGNY